MPLFTLSKSSSLPQLPKQAWELILLWLHPIQAIRCARICKLTRDIIQSKSYWETKSHWDFGLQSTSMQYPQLLRKLYLDKNHRKISNLSFGVTSKKIFYGDLSESNSKILMDHVVQLNRLAYRNLKPIKYERFEHSIRQNVCQRCNSNNITIWGDPNYVDCRNCGGNAMLDWSVETVWTGRYSLKIYRAKDKSGCIIV